VRLTSDGFLKLCLDSPIGVDLKSPLRQGITNDDLLNLIKEGIHKKPKSHHFEGNRETIIRNMNQIGG
jgi:cyclic pyranopterin phosphate synthase